MNIKISVAMFDNHPQTVFYRVFFILNHFIRFYQKMCNFAPNSRTEYRQTPERNTAKFPNGQIKLHVYG